MTTPANPLTPAQILAGQLFNNYSAQAGAYRAARANGVPARAAQGNSPAVAAISAADFATALGGQLAAFDAAYGYVAPTT